MNKKVLTFDFGASSGRAILSKYEGEKITLQEVHRFSNDPVDIGNTLYWDVLRLFYEVKQGILKAKQNGGFDAIGIDTWGVDFGLIDKNGELISNPVHYRDLRTENIPELAFKKMSKDEIYERTGIQFMRINTLYQLYYLVKNRPEIIEKIEKMLFMPDLFAYFLTGEKRSELTIASTSNMLNPYTKTWDTDILSNLEIPERIFPKMIKPGEQYGYLKKSIAEELGCDTVPVIAVSTHDTASAVLAVPAENEDFVYVSCGTWSLFGSELKNPVINEESAAANFTNEGGYNNTIRFLKNIMGLWIFQESCRQWKREGKEIVYKELDKKAENSAPFKCFIDPDSPQFETPGNVPRRIREFCEKTGQYVPQTDGEIVRCIFESLAMKYRYSLENLNRITNKEYDTIHMVGGGINAKILCEFTASACNKKVLAGPIEATALGNAVAQFISLGVIKDVKSARKTIKNSIDFAQYEPKDADAWNKAYNDFLNTIK